MAKRVCAEPGCPVLIDQPGRCSQHRRESPTYTERDWRERKRRQSAVTAWVARNGWICPGWQRPAHPSHDLTADHLVPVARGGADGPLRVLCRSCNSSRGVGGGGDEPPSRQLF